MPPSAASKTKPMVCPPGCMDAKVAQRVIAAASDIALVIDHQGVIEDVTVAETTPANTAWASLKGKRWVETIAPDSQRKVEQLLQEARASQVSRAREINQADGSNAVPFRFSAVLLDAKQRVVALGRDLRALASLQQDMVNAQQSMDRELGRMRQAETRYRLLFQVTSESVIVAEAATLRVVEVNQATTLLFDEPPHALQGRSLPELFESRGWSSLQALVGAVEAGGRASDVKVKLRSRAPREVTVSLSMFRQSGAAYLLLRVRPADQAATAAGSRDARMLAVLEALPDAFVVVGEDRRILAANSAFCDLVQQASEKQVLGEPLDRWLGRPGVDLNLMLANLREHQTIRNFATIVRGEYGSAQEATVSAVAATDGKVPCIGFTIRAAPARLAAASPAGRTLRSIEQLQELVGRVSLKEIVRESADLIERLCIEAALRVSGDNRASAAQLLGLSRQGLYSKLRRHGLGDLDASEVD